MRTPQPPPAPSAQKAEALRLAVELYEASNTTGVRFSDRGRPIQDSWLREAARRLAAARPPDEGQPTGEDDWKRAKRSWAEQELERPRRGGRTLGSPPHPPASTPDPSPPAATGTDSDSGSAQRPDDGRGKPGPASGGGSGA